MDFERLLKLRLVVARFGEMDAMGWWNTNGVLSRLGKTVLSRGFPKTDFFAQSRIVFEAARLRCRETFNPPNSVTLWELPPSVEDAFDGKWHRWCGSCDTWKPFAEALINLNGDDLLAAFCRAGLFDRTDEEQLKRLRRGPEGRSVPIVGRKTLDGELIGLLALGFCKGTKRELLVPYASDVEVPSS